MTEATKTEQETKLKKEEKTIKASSCTSRKRCWVSVFAILLLISISALFGSMPWWACHKNIPHAITQLLPVGMCDYEIAYDVAQELETLKSRVEQLEMGKSFDAFPVSSASTNFGDKKISDQLAIHDLRLKELGVSVEEARFALGEISRAKKEESNLEPIKDSIIKISAKNDAIEMQLDKITQETKILTQAIAENQNVANKLSELEKRVTASDPEREKALAALVVLNHIMPALDDGMSYAEAMSDLLNIAETMPAMAKEIEVLNSFAERGVVSIAELITSYSELAPKAAWAAVKVEKSGVGGQIISRLKSMIAIRNKNTENKEDNVAAINQYISDAEALLKEGNLAKALDALALIDDKEVLEVLAPWIEKATKRLDAKQNFNLLMTKAVSAALGKSAAN